MKHSRVTAAWFAAGIAASLAVALPRACLANETCTTAEAITVNGPSVTASNEAAVDDNTAFCGTSSPNRGIWYVVTGTGNTMKASNCLPGTDFDAKIQVFCDCGPMVCVGGNDDAAGAPPECDLSGLNRKSIVEWCSDLGHLYYIHVGGFGSTTGTFELTVTDAAGCSPSVDCTTVLLENVVQQVLALNLQQGIENNLDAKLDAAQQALQDFNANNDVAACNSLQAFINAVDAQRGKQISEADANAISAAVQEIMVALGCS